MLVVDDEPDIVDFVERVFRREYKVERAHSVEEALPLIEDHAAAPLDVLITDERMPRRSGTELLDRAAALQPQAVRVLLSGFGSPDARGADAQLFKPVDGESLKQAVAEAIARRAATAGGGRSAT
jgi:DNA-binding NtrC family response regulator